MTPTIALADEAVLVLLDGQELAGVGVERLEDGGYVLTLSTGDKLALPAALVVEVRLSASEPREPEPPTGIREGEPEDLSGTAGRATTPSVAERLGALGDPEDRRFPSSVVDPTWTPESDWGEESDVTRFNTADWFRAPVDPTWTPTSASDAQSDVLSGSRYTWRRNLIDNAWRPSDGFRLRDRFFEESAGEPESYRPEFRFVEP
jgi:hypothetical protein